jgi:pimeloyl-ACP methyl ester carboxylesterase
MCGLFRHLSLGALFALALTRPVIAQATGDTASFAVLIDGARVGSQTVSLTKTADGWLIASFGRLDAPFNIVTNKLEVTYDAAWQARQLVFDGTVDGAPVTLTTKVSPSTATNELVRGGEKASNVQPVSPASIVMPDNFFGAYEALAARLASAAPGTKLPVYRAPEGEVLATVDRVTPRKIVTDSGAIAVREFALTFAMPRGSAPVEIWTDERNRLVRVALPVSSVVVLRDDLSSVMTREDHGQNPGDEAVFIPGNGFSLGATITKPSNVAKAPAVILAAGPGTPGRDRVAHGVVSYGRLAGTLADAGYFVVRYDARGSGQSGGRSEGASLLSYRDDVLSVVQWLRRRPDVDAERMVVVGYGDSGAVALLAARREGRVRGVALLAAPGRTGRDVVLDQQREALGRLKISDAERAERIALQTRVIEATVSGRGWENISDELRHQADTPWFRTWLAFDPAETIEDLRQPLLIVQGALDTEVPATDADRLATLSQTARDVPAAHTRKVVIAGVNHLFVPATTGEVAEYATLRSRAISPAVGEALVDWLHAIAPARR